MKKIIVYTFPVLFWIATSAQASNNPQEQKQSLKLSNPLEISTAGDPAFGETLISPASTSSSTGSQRTPKKRRKNGSLKNTRDSLELYSRQKRANSETSKTGPTNPREKKFFSCLSCYASSSDVAKK